YRIESPGALAEPRRRLRMAAALGTGQRVDLVHPLDEHGPGLAGAAVGRSRCCLTAVRVTFGDRSSTDYNPVRFFGRLLLSQAGKLMGTSTHGRPGSSSEPSSISSTLLRGVRARQPEAWQRLVALYGPT